MQKRLREFLLGMALLIATIIVFLIFFEIALRIFYPQEIFPVDIYDNSLTRRYVLKPNFYGVHTHPDFTVSYQTNSRGLRGPEHSYAKEEGTFRILVIGDSMTFGEGVEWEDSYPILLGDLLNQDSKQFEVINAAIPAQGTGQELVFLMEEGYKYKPDMILLGFYIGNDITDNHYWPVVFFENDTLVQRELDYHDMAFREYTDSIPFYNEIITNSHAIIFFKYRISILIKSLRKKEISSTEGDTFETRNLFVDDGNEIKQSAWNLTFRLIREVDEFSREMNASLAVVVLPAHYQVYPGEFREQYSEDEQPDFSIPNKLLEDFSEREGIPVIDLLPEFRETKEEIFFPIDRHFNEKGSRLAAEAIHRALIDKGMLLIDKKNG